VGKEEEALRQKKPKQKKEKEGGKRPDGESLSWGRLDSATNAHSAFGTDRQGGVKTREGRRKKAYLQTATRSKRNKAPSDNSIPAWKWGEKITDKAGMGKYVRHVRF